MCKGKLENKSTSFMADLENCIIIVKNVPSQVCSQCGEISYNNEVARQLEKIVNAVKSTVITEIAVVNYSEKVA
jgi:YgiT-type zinc finger domain-containing protein